MPGRNLSFFYKCVGPFQTPPGLGGRGGGVPAGQSQCSGTRSYSGKQHGACERLWRSIGQALRSSLGPTGPGELQMNASRCGGKSEPGDRRPDFQCQLDSGRGANPRSLPRPLPHVQTDRIPVSRLDTSWAQNVLGQRLLFRLCQLVNLQPLPLLAWGCFHPFPGLSESGPGTGEPGGSPSFLHLPHPSTHPSGAALRVVIHRPGFLGGPSLVLF